MDGSTKSFEVDPAITCGELCQLIKEKLGLRNVFGFSIYVASLEQVSSSSCFEGYFSVFFFFGRVYSYPNPDPISDTNTQSSSFFTTIKVALYVADSSSNAERVSHENLVNDPARWKSIRPVYGHGFNSLWEVRYFVRAVLLTRRHHTFLFISQKEYPVSWIMTNSPTECEIRFLTLTWIVFETLRPSVLAFQKVNSRKLRRCYFCGIDADHCSNRWPTGAVVLKASSMLCLWPSSTHAPKT